MRTIETPAEFAELMKECIRQVRFYVDKAAVRCSIQIPYPRVLFNLKGATAGKAWWHKNEIHFSPTLLRENPDDFLIKTSGHEVAHLVARAKYGAIIKPHGSEWQQVMWNLGLPAIRCHNYNTNNVDSRVNKIRRVIQQGPIKTVSIGKIIEFN